jgi:hypothetical protein
VGKESENRERRYIRSLIQGQPELCSEFHNMTLSQKEKKEKNYLTLSVFL